MPATAAEFCRLAIGDIEVTYVPDGILTSSPLRSFPGTEQALWDANPQYLDADGLVVMSLGALLIRTAGKVLLIDLAWGPNEIITGVGTGYRTGVMRGGALIDNLRWLGVSPGDVDAILFSHLHRDHIGWLVDPLSATSAVAPMFPRATNYLAAPELHYWTAQSALGAPFSPTGEELAVLGARLTLVEDGQTLFPGIDVVATFGHTPGHLSFVISSGSDRALVLGDAVHCPIEILEPELTFSADVDPKMAQRARTFIERTLLDTGTIAAAPHFADLVFGRLLKGEGRSTWQFPETQRLAVAG